MPAPTTMTRGMWRFYRPVRSAGCQNGGFIYVYAGGGMVNELQENERDFGARCNPCYLPRLRRKWRFRGQSVESSWPLLARRRKGGRRWFLRTLRWVTGLGG